MTDRPAVEARLLCSEPVTVRAECLSVSFQANRYVNSSYYPEFNTLTSSTFRYIVNYKTNDTAAQGTMTMDLEAKRCDQHASPDMVFMFGMQETFIGQHSTCTSLVCNASLNGMVMWIKGMHASLCFTWQSPCCTGLALGSFLLAVFDIFPCSWLPI